MSTRMNQYIIEGIRLNYHKYEDHVDDFESYFDNGYEGAIKHKNGLVVLYDGMMGKFIFVGRLLRKSRIDEPIDDNDGVFMFEPTPGDKEELLINLITMSFPFVEIPAEGVRTYLVTEYH